MQNPDQITLKEKSKPGSKELKIDLENYPTGIISLLALNFNGEGFPDKGFSLLISALREEPDRWELYDKLVILAVRAEKQAEAEKALLEAHALFPDSFQVCGSLGKLFFLQGKFLPAGEFLEKSIKLNPEDGVSHLFLALSRLGLFSEEDRTDSAEFPELLKIEREVQKFKELNPEMIDDALLRGEELLTQGNHSEAFKFLEKNLSNYLDKEIKLARFHQLFCSLHLESGESDLEKLKEYIQELEKKLKISSPPAETLNHLGCAYLLFFINLIKSGEEQLEKALSLDPEFEAASKALDCLKHQKKGMVALLNSLKF
jgi:tetratricopeptide (TPR) repeat protein